MRISGAKPARRVPPRAKCQPRLCPAARIAASSPVPQIPGIDMRQPLTLAALLLALALPVPSAVAQEQPLTTVAERSGFVQTGRYAEVVELCGAFAERYPDAV